MSSSTVVARAAIRATRTAGQRQFSIMQKMRQTARSFEPHPFQRLPIEKQPQAGDWGRHFKAAGGNALIYFPFFAVVLGWPLLAARAFKGRM